MTSTWLLKRGCGKIIPLYELLFMSLTERLNTLIMDFGLGLAIFLTLVASRYYLMVASSDPDGSRYRLCIWSLLRFDRYRNYQWMAWFLSCIDFGSYPLIVTTVQSLPAPKHCARNLYTSFYSIGSNGWHWFYAGTGSCWALRELLSGTILSFSTFDVWWRGSWMESPLIEDYRGAFWIAILPRGAFIGWGIIVALKKCDWCPCCKSRSQSWVAKCDASKHGRLRWIKRRRQQFFSRCAIQTSAHIPSWNQRRIDMLLRVIWSAQELMSALNKAW